MSKFEEQTFKTCKRCNRLLPVDNFYTNIRYNRLNKKGEPIKYYYSYCKDCMKITSRVNKGKRVYKYNITYVLTIGILIIRLEGFYVESVI